jgi:hypothetical protein
LGRLHRSEFFLDEARCVGAAVVCGDDENTIASHRGAEIGFLHDGIVADVVWQFLADLSAEIKNDDLVYRRARKFWAGGMVLLLPWRGGNRWGDESGGQRQGQRWRRSGAETQITRNYVRGGDLDRL